MEIATQMAMLSAQRTQGLVEIAVAKKSHQMQMDFIAMIDDVARAAPPPGQGTQVDKSA
ncbi:MAG: hypothetical protein ACO1OK_10970 [Devosia sp.]